MGPIEHLQDECTWEHPPSYGGHSPVGDFLIYSRNRDSSILENVNYDEILRVLREEQEKQCEAPEVEGEEYTPWVYDFRASHWGVGWVEYIIVRKEAPEALLTLAGEIFCALSDYPVFSDDLYSEAQHEAICEYWENCGAQEQMEYLIKSGMPEAEADRLTDLDDAPPMPDSAYDELSQSEMFY